MARRGWAAAWVGALVACGGAGTSVETDHAARRAGYPQALCIVGEGESREGRAEAEARAKARVAEQVRSEVASELVDVTGVEDGRDYQRVMNQVRVSAGFRHAELIRVSSGPGRDRDGLFRATACLERAEAVPVLMDEYRRDSERFRLEAGRAMQARGEAVRFTPPFRQAEEAFAGLAEKALLVRVVEGRGRFPADYERDRQEFSRLMAARNEVLSGVRVTVLPGEVDPPGARGHVVQALVSAVASLGVTTVSEGLCTSGYAIVPDARIACSSGFVGVKCGVTIRARLTDCSNRSDVVVLALGEVASGAHPREPDLARAEALRALKAEALAPRLREESSGVLPLP